jgi:hypothetical protein
MLQSSRPTTYTTNEQLTPEKLNRTIQSVVAQLEGEAAKRWRTFDISLPTSSTTVIARLPLIEGFQYVIDRVTISGYYTGTPAISWKKENDTTTKAIVLPAGDGTTFYSTTFFPGVLLDGYLQTTNSNNFQLDFDTVQANLRATISLRSPRGMLSDATRISAINLYKDQDVLTAAGFLAIRDTLNNFGATLDVSDSPPKYLGHTFFKSITSSTALSQRTDRLPGDAGQRVTRVVGHIELSGFEAGQEVTVSYGWGSNSSSTVVSITGTSIEFDSGALSLLFNNRTPSNQSSDWVCTVANSHATHSITKIQIYTLMHTP